MKSTFFVSRGLFPLCMKQNNTWLFHGLFLLQLHGLLRSSWQDVKHLSLFFTELKPFHLLFYLQKWCNRLCWSLQYAGYVSYYLRNRPRSPWSLCAETKGLRFNSSRGLRIFFFVSRSWRDVKNLSIFLYRAQNLPSLFFYWKKCFWGNWTGTLNTVFNTSIKRETNRRGKPWPYFVFTWT